MTCRFDDWRERERTHCATGKLAAIGQAKQTRCIVWRAN